MGGCNSTEAKIASLDSKITKKNKKDYENDQSKIKLLLLGPGESGKTTIFKNMRILYGQGYSTDERRQMTSIVFNNTVTSMKAILLMCDNLDTPVDKSTHDEFLALGDDAEIDEHVASLITQLWQDPGIQAVYRQSSTFQLNDCAKYFFEKVAELASPKYIPSVEDVLRVRARTSGILEDNFIIDQACFTVYDVGGQRNERRKWIRCFDEVTAIIFVAAISEFDQTLYEDSQTNRLIESLNLFEEVVNSRWFNNSSIILMLNKEDIFLNKIKTVDLATVPNPHPVAAEKTPFLFDDYTGGVGNVQASLQYIIQKFLSRNRNPDKKIYYHVTSATNTGNVRVVLQGITETILRANLEAGGITQ